MISSAKNRKVIESGAAAGGGITSLTGDVTATGPGAATATLSNTGVAAGTYGDATHVGQFTVDAKGRISLAANVVIDQTPIGFTSTSTGTVNDLNFSNADVIYLNNATDLTLTGLVAGVTGQLVTIKSIGAGNVYLSHLAGSSGANQFSNYVTSGPTPLAAGFGSATYAYDATNSKWSIVAHDQGNFISIPFASCTYDSNTGAFWTVVVGDISVQKIYITGRVATIIISINSTTTTLAGVGTRLRINFAAFLSYTFTDTTRSFARVVDGGAAQLGMATGGAGTASLLQFSTNIADTAWGIGINRGMNGITLLLGLT